MSPLLANAVAKFHCRASPQINLQFAAPGVVVASFVTFDRTFDPSRAAVLFRDSCSAVTRSASRARMASSLAFQSGLGLGLGVSMASSLACCRSS